MPVGHVWGLLQSWMKLCVRTEYLVPLIMSYPTQCYPRMLCKARLLQSVLQTKSLRSYRRCLSSGCHTKSNRLGGLNNRNQFSYSSGAWKSKIWVQVLLWWDFLASTFALCLHEPERGRDLLCSSSFIPETLYSEKMFRNCSPVLTVEMSLLTSPTAPPLIAHEASWLL